MKSELKKKKKKIEKDTIMSEISNLSRWRKDKKINNLSKIK